MAGRATAGTSKEDGLFQPTQWSVVLAAGRSNGPSAREALATLCQVYWQPLYVYVRRRGYSVEDAQDLTQGFFSRLIEKRALRHAHRERGRFRAFLLASLKNYLANEWDRSRAVKRGSGVLELDFDLAEKSVAKAVESDPERIYERRWAQRVLEEALARVKGLYREQERTFEILKGSLGGGRSEGSYRDLGEALGISEGAARVAAHRLRQRYRAALREVVGQTVRDPADVEDEIRSLLRVLAG
jgi:RNA polymerase sigma-70 factor (ECF subfamily)